MSADTNDAIYSRLGEDPTYRELVADFVAGLPARIETFVGLCEAGDWNRLRFETHQLKGVVGSYGFHAATPVVEKLNEALAGQISPVEICKRVDALVALLPRLRSGRMQ